jgi:hypothetical protein
MVNDISLPVTNNYRIGWLSATVEKRNEEGVVNDAPLWTLAWKSGTDM